MATAVTLSQIIFQYNCRQRCWIIASRSNRRRCHQMFFYCGLWPDLQTNENLQRISANLKNFLRQKSIKVKKKMPTFVMNFWNFITKVKNVVKRQKIYEYFGLEWRTPLWDVDFMQFWIKALLNKNMAKRITKSRWTNLTKLCLECARELPEICLPKTFRFDSALQSFSTIWRANGINLKDVISATLQKIRVYLVLWTIHNWLNLGIFGITSLSTRTFMPNQKI